MNSVTNRIRQIFEGSKENKSDIAKRLKVTPAYISKLTKNDDAVPSDRLIDDICLEFGYRKKWVLTGEGDPTVSTDRDKEISDFAGKLLHDENDSFRKRFIAALSGLTADDWKALEHIVDEIANRKADQ